VQSNSPIAHIREYVGRYGFALVTVDALARAELALDEDEPDGDAESHKRWAAALDAIRQAVIWATRSRMP